MTSRVFALGAIVSLIAAAPCFGQADRPLEWLQELSAVAASSGSSGPQQVIEQRRARIAGIRTEIEEWIALHPGLRVDVPPAPQQPWTEEQTRAEIAVLKRAVETLLKSDPNHPFNLGVTVVHVTDSAAALSPVFDVLDRTEIQNHDALTVNQAIEYLPGVSVDHKSPRNQTGISIGGFDSRQVPLFLDGIPAYVPFDGYVDLNRYLTSDIAEIQVAKGYSSPLLGPNALGGVINLVTRQPHDKLEADAFIGTGSGNLLDSGLHLGSRWRRFFFQGSIDWLQSDFYPISGAFKLNAQQPNDHRVNSYQRDEHYSARVAWTPRGQDSYVLSYSNQKGNAGIPPYSGSAPVCPSGNATVPFPCVTPKFWTWPQWNADSYYFNSTTSLGEMSSIRVRAFYEEFPNVLNMYDDATYSTLTKPSSAISRNDDHSFGTSGEFDTRLVSRNVIAASFFVNDDNHQEQTTTFSTAGVPSATPHQTNRDLQSSFGVQDVITVTSRIRATLGFSADHLDGLQAQDLNSTKTGVAPFQVQRICSATSSLSFDSCTDHVWVYNPVGSLSYATSKSGTLFVTFAEKSRFPTLKDRYSYKAGKAVPNPLLRPEHARSWSAGYSHALALRTVFQLDFFRSDVRNEIENTFFLSPLCSGGGKGGAGSCQQAVNVGRETHQGANFTLRTTQFSRVTFDANYTFLNRKITGAPGVFPNGTPKHKTIGSATVRLPRGATGLVSARYQAGTVGMSDNSLPLPVSKFATVDLEATVPIRAGISVQTGLKNLLDRNYYYWEGFPEAGRTWYLTLRYKF
jgi:iron complex outermembrane receptor protein